jgi:hypothetical protein
MTFRRQPNTDASATSLRARATDEHGADHVPDWVLPGHQQLYARVVSKLPAFPDSETFAKVWTGDVSKISHRSLERVPLSTRRLNRRRCYDRQEIVDYFFRQMQEAPVIMAGRRVREAA